MTLIKTFINLRNEAANTSLLVDDYLIFML